LKKFVETPATERLRQSRERLRQALLQSKGTRHGTAAGTEPASKLPRAWKELLLVIPGASLLSNAFSGWWAQHPVRIWYTAGVAVCKTLRSSPAVAQHPLFLVGSAMLMGAAVVAIRPWRWLFKPALVAASLWPRWLYIALAQVPKGLVMATLTELMR
jgi:hypothetical protein